ncbi:hypothetical protein BIT28_16455 [Photobacterium proteolyticum]|uniref:GNAT family N-acetyltransferase n=1 Tax=Photobacterium proteolyticum TaxID=1903952 RepID=A0A1Q9G7P8_9GAMM|nr:hypothetical protein [Photobacterium proteolyticum]OLQ70316.1 hypothetical protein BIT28_16455 [Photobacterium proteolyticum]
MANEKMTIIYLTAARADWGYHLNQLKPAFNGSDSARAEFEEMAERLNSGAAALYLVKAKGVLIRFVGHVTDGVYHINAMTGRGLKHAAPLIIERCQAMGYQAISYHTYRNGMGRILRGFGFELDEQISQTERRYLLGLEVSHG